MKQLISILIVLAVLFPLTQVSAEEITSKIQGTLIAPEETTISETDNSLPEAPPAETNEMKLPETGEIVQYNSFFSGTIFLLASFVALILRNFLGGRKISNEK